MEDNNIVSETSAPAAPQQPTQEFRVLAEQHALACAALRSWIGRFHALKVANGDMPDEQMALRIDADLSALRRALDHAAQRIVMRDAEAEQDNLLAGIDPVLAAQM
jgi:hypothetical protein